MSIRERIARLRELMKERNIDAYIIPSGDPHQSEYVAEHYASRAYITGFTGSAGTAVITLTEAGLWTDGRYFVQAEQQLKDTGVTLFRMGEKGVPSIQEYLSQSLNESSTIGFDGKVISLNYFRSLNKALINKHFNYYLNEDLIDLVWTDRPQIPSTDVLSHDVIFTGKSREEKLSHVTEVMKKQNATHYLISGLDDIAWLFNIRGRDIPFNPLTIAYAVVTLDQAFLFIDEEKLGEDVLKELEDAKVSILPYEDVKTYVESIDQGRVLLDPSKTNLWLFNRIKVDVVESMDPTTLLKAVKNEVEVENIRNVMVRDGVAMVKFIHWIKETIKTRSISEIEAVEQLHTFRAMDDRFVDESFSTISAYQANAAMPHYHATEEQHSTIEAKGFYLVDSGGQYYDGTTDITRTLVMGELTNEEIHDYTLVLKGMINLSEQQFVYGTTGSSLDILARMALWNEGLDFKHGTGHGIGFFLNVHEGPHRISTVPNSIKLEHGMITSNEPGIYKSGRHGIRIENLIVVRKAIETEFGQFMNFETLTLCPIDTDAIDVERLTVRERAWLNSYHQLVFDKLAPHLSGDELNTLKEATKSI